MNKLRIAVVGGGHLGRIHARLLSTLETVELVGVVEPSADARNMIVQQGHRCVSTLDEIVAATGGIFIDPFVEMKSQ